MFLKTGKYCLLVVSALFEPLYRPEGSDKLYCEGVARKSFLVRRERKAKLVSGFVLLFNRYIGEKKINFS
jgi:hypothetical protein